MTDIQANRLSRADIDENLGDLHPPLARPQALVEAERCYFCFEAPCTTACPTGIDIPSFIRKIRTGNLRGAAKTILSQNIMGGMCARVCPTEVLCEDACVRHAHEDKPVEIGQLQRYATDHVLERNLQLFSRAAASGRKVAVVGAGPAGLSCAHGLAVRGHDVVVYHRDAKPGGLNEYGIAAYKAVDDFAQREIAYILSIGGIELRSGTLGEDLTLERLRQEYEAVFIAVGLSGVNALGVEGEQLPGVENAVEYIAGLRQAEDRAQLPVGRRVVVIGGGMTAIDVAVQSKCLGAEQVDIVYRRGPDQMGASAFEQELAQINGVTIHHFAQPIRVTGDGQADGVLFENTLLDEQGRLSGTGETFRLEADVVFKAIGQRLRSDDLGSTPLAIRGGKIVVDEQHATSVPGVWAGGDCVTADDDLTVTAVQHGKLAAMAIDFHLRTKEQTDG